MAKKKVSRKSSEMKTNMESKKGKPNCANAGQFLLRLLVGIIFLYHGIMKFLNLSGTMNFFANGVHIWGWLGVVIAVVEVLGGLMLILGLWSKWASYVLGVVMLGALILVTARFPVAAGFERDMLLLFALIVIATGGPGRCAITAND